MLKLSTKGRYGTRFMLYLALNHGRGCVMLKDIAQKEEISRGYLEQLIPLLKVKGLIRSTRGAYGGYMLNKKPNKITLYEILEALEGSLAPVECVDTPAHCGKADFCIPRKIWLELARKISETLRSVTLQDMADKQKNEMSLNYTI